MAISYDKLLQFRDWLWAHGMITRQGLEEFDRILGIDTRKRDLEGR